MLGDGVSVEPGGTFPHHGLGWTTLLPPARGREQGDPPQAPSPLQSSFHHLHPITPNPVALEKDLNSLLRNRPPRGTCHQTDAAMSGACERSAKAEGKPKERFPGIFRVVVMWVASSGKERGCRGENQHQIPLCEMAPPEVGGCSACSPCAGRESLISF